MISSPGTTADPAAVAEWSGTESSRHPAAFISLAILLLFVVISYVDRTAIVLLVDPIKRDFGITDLQVSYLQGIAFAVCFGLAAPVLGWVSDRYSPRWVIFGGMTFWSFATVACGLAQNYAALFVARFMVGVGEAALMPAAFIIIADLFPRKQLATAFGILAAGTSIGGGMAVGGIGILAQWSESAATQAWPIIGSLAAWQKVFVIIGLPGIPMAALIFLVPGRQRRQPVADPGNASVQLLPWLGANALPVLGFAFAASLLYAIGYGVANWTPTYLLRTFDLKLAEVGVVLGAVQLVAGTVGFVGSGFVFDWLGRKGVANPTYLYLRIVLVVVTLGGVTAFAAAPTPTIAFIALGVLHLVLPFTGVLAAHIQLITPRPFRAQMLATVTTIYTIFGMIAGPTAIAGLTDIVFADPQRLGWSVTIAMVAFAMLSLALLQISGRSMRKLLDVTKKQERLAGSG